jgi:hypothetical protein
MTSFNLKLVRTNTPIKLSKSDNVFIATTRPSPTLSTTAINELSRYSNTEAMLGNVSTSYSNAINYVDTALLSYTNTASLELNTLNDIDSTQLSNNATLVYDTNDNKYVVKQLDLDGGNF